jgi:hypothetical protein
MLFSQVKVINIIGLHYILNMQCIQAILIIINHDYIVVIDPYSYHHIIMKLIILRNVCNGHVLPISEGIMETRATLNLARVITWQHDTRGPRRHHEWQQFTTTIKESSRAHLTLVSSSTRMPRWTYCGWPRHYPILHPWSRVGYRPTQRSSKLLCLRDPIKSRMSQYTAQTCSPGSNNQSLTDTGGGYHLRASNIRSDHSPSFPSSILLLSA